MGSLILASTLGTILYLIIEILLVFGGAVFFTWLVVIGVRKWFKVPPPTDTKRHKDTSRNAALIELRYQVENTRLQTQKLRLEQEKLRLEREARGE